MGSNVKVADVMVKNVLTIDKGKGVVEAAKAMKKRGVGSIVVVDGNKGIGIITERDLVRKVLAEEKFNAHVEEIMSKPLIVVKPDTTIEEAAKVMRDYKIKRLIVIDDSGVMKGIIAEDDIVKLLPSLIELIEEKAYAYGLGGDGPYEE